MGISRITIGGLGVPANHVACDIIRCTAAAHYARHKFFLAGHPVWNDEVLRCVGVQAGIPVNQRVARDVGTQRTDHTCCHQRRA